MPGSVLIIDADEEFAARLKSTLEVHGAQVQTTGDGRAGLDMARVNIPNAIVVCVELPRMSGYSICAKLKKDPNLKTVTLVITSAEATQETFEHHKKLKNRAEEYLRKPFDPQTLVTVLQPYLDLQAVEGAVAPPLPDVDLPPIVEAELPELPELPVDDDFSDNDGFHFDHAPIDVDRSVAVEPAGIEVDSDPDLVDNYEEDEVMTTIGVVPPAGTEALFKEIEQLRGELEAEREAHAQTVRDRDEALENERAAVGQLQALSTGSPSQVSASRDLLAIKKELHDRDKQLLELKDAVQQKERDILSQRDREMDFEGQLVQLQEDLETGQRVRGDLESRLTDAESRVTEAHRAREEDAARLQDTISTLSGEIEGLKEEVGQRDRTIGAHEDEITSLRSTNQALNGEVTRLTNELSATAAESSELRDQLQTAQAHANEVEGELQNIRQQAESTLNALEATQASLLETEEQVARAFERIRHDGETKTKVRQALDIALRLLTEPSEDDQDGMDDGATVVTTEEVHP